MKGKDVAQDVKSRKGWAGYVPAVGALADYRWETLRRDTVAGVTVAAVAVPQAMAYASIFGVPVQYGLYTAIVMTAVGAIFDSSKQLINGPTNAISIALLSALANVPGDERIQAAILMAAMIGAIQIGITLFRLGDLSRYISHAVIVGFTLGAAVLLMLDQLKNLCGLQGQGAPHDHFLVRFWATLRDGGPIHWPTCATGCATILLVLAMRWGSRKLRLVLPELLLAIVVVSWAVHAVGSTGIALVPQIPRSLPTFAPPAWDGLLVRELAGSAMAIGLLGLLEAIAMAKAIAARTGQSLDINQQCLSEGVANLTGSFFQCFPGSGSLTRSYINHQAGAMTQWSGVIAAATVGLTVVALAPLAQYIPRAALAGILIVSAARMVDVRHVGYYLRATRFDAAIVIATALSAVVVSIEFCILIGVFLSFFFYVPRAARVQLTELVLTPAKVVRARLQHDITCERLKIYDLEGEWFFGSAPDVETQLERIEQETTGGVRFVILRIKHVRNLDAMCAHLLERFWHRLQTRRIQLVLCGVRDDVLQVLTNTQLVAQLGADHVFEEKPEMWSSTLLAIQTVYRQLNGDVCTHCPRRNEDLAGPTDWHYMI